MRKAEKNNVFKDVGLNVLPNRMLAQFGNSGVNLKIAILSDLGVDGLSRWTENPKALVRFREIALETIIRKIYMLKDYVVEFFMKTKLFRMIEERENFQKIVEDSINETIKNLGEFFNNKESSNNFLEKIVDSIKKIRETNLQTSKKRAISDVIDAINIVCITQIKSIVECSYGDALKLLGFVNNHFLDLCCSDQEISKEKILEILHEDI